MLRNDRWRYARLDSSPMRHYRQEKERRCSGNVCDGLPRRLILQFSGENEVKIPNELFSFRHLEPLEITAYFVELSEVVLSRFQLRHAVGAVGGGGSESGERS